MYSNNDSGRGYSLIGWKMLKILITSLLLFCPNLVNAQTYYDVSDQVMRGNPDGSTYVGGNIGMGSTSPGYTMDINGTVRAVAFVGVSNTYVQTSATRTFVSTSSSTGFQVSASRWSHNCYSATIQTVASIGSNQQGSIVLEIAATNSSTPSDWTEIGRLTNGQILGLAVALSSTQPIGATLCGYVPSGYYSRLRTINTTGTPTYTYNSGQETLL